MTFRGTSPLPGCHPVAPSTETATGDSGASPYLSFIVALHVATAIALLVYFRKDWVAIIRALISTVRTRKIQTSTERLAVLLVVATIPVGITGLALEHSFRTLFAKPMAAAAFLTVNAVILFAGERLRRGAEARANGLNAGAQARAAGLSAGPGAATEADIRSRRANRQLETLSYREAGIIGLFQTLALLAGISRSGITMVGGLLRGLDHEDAAKFSFLLATPVILAAGVLKPPSLTGSAGDHIHGQILAGFLTAGICAYAAVRFLSRYFTTRTLTPFAIYCLVAGVGSMIWFA